MNLTDISELDLNKQASSWANLLWQGGCSIFSVQSNTQCLVVDLFLCFTITVKIVL